MDSPRVLVGFGRWPKGGRMLSIVVKIMPLGENQTEVAAGLRANRTLSDIALSGEQLTGEPYYGCNTFPSLLKFYGNRRAVICDREFVGA